MKSDNEVDAHKVLPLIQRTWDEHLYLCNSDLNLYRCNSDVRAPKTAGWFEKRRSFQIVYGILHFTNFRRKEQSSWFESNENSSKITRELLDEILQVSIHWIANCIHLLYVEGAPLNCSQIPKECRGVRIVLRMNEVGTLVKDFMCMKSQGTITLWHVRGFYKRLAHINNNSQLESKSCCLLWVLWELLVFSCAILILKSFNIWTSIWWIIST